MTDERLDRLDALWAEMLLDACASDGPIRDNDVRQAIAHYRPKIEAALNDAAVRERDELRAAAEEVCRSWFDRLETDVDPPLRQALVDLRAALHREAGA